MGTRMQQRRGTSAEWAASNVILSEGELGYDKTTGEVRMGDGVTHWVDLPDGNRYIPKNTLDATYVARGIIDAAGDLLVGSADNTAVRLPKGTVGQRLTIDGAGNLIWADLPPEDNPFTVVNAAGDLLVGSADDAVTRLAKGADGTVLSVTAGAVGWTLPPAGSSDELRLQRIMDPGRTCPSLRRGAPVSLSGANQAIHTVATGRKSVVKSVIVTNTSNTAGTVTLAINGILGLATAIPVAAFSAVTIDAALVLNAGEVINASMAGALGMNASVIYADLVNSEVPVRYGVVNGSLAANTWGTLFTAPTNLVITSLWVSNNGGSSSRFALRVGTSGPATFDAPTMAVNTLVHIDTPIYVANGTVVQAYDFTGGVLGFAASGYPAIT